MSSINPEGSTNPEHNLTPAEVENLDRLEAIAVDGLGAYLQVGNALAEIRDRQLYRDSHPSFETYVRDRLGIDIPGGDQMSLTTISADAPVTSTIEQQPRAALRNKPCEALARACDETLSALAADDRMRVEIRLAIRKQRDPDMPADEQSVDAWRVAEHAGDDLLPTLRWLLTQASGTIGAVANELESRAADIDDGARAQLRDDVIVVDGELAVVKALLFDLVDWDSELRRLLEDKLPPFNTGPDPEDNE
jgi:hypothetical protein